LKANKIPIMLACGAHWHWSPLVSSWKPISSGLWPSTYPSLHHCTLWAVSLDDTLEELSSDLLLTRSHTTLPLIADLPKFTWSTLWPLAVSCLLLP
jgi:hypothetical protein